jgi:Fe-S cluster assembly protein SufD
MGNPVTTRGFTERALLELTRHEGEGAGALGRLREEAFALFETLPMPSPDTEEWRYTDLRDLDLDLEPFAPREPLRTLEEAGQQLSSLLGSTGERAGMVVQHDSTVVWTTLDEAVRARGVRVEGLDSAARRAPEEVLRRLHRAVPTDRSRFVAMHAAFRSGGVFAHVPANVRVDAPVESITYVDSDGLAVFPHTVIVLDEGAELTFIDRYVSPDLGRAFSDAVVELYLGPGSKLRYVGLQEWGRGMTHLSVQRAVLDRDAELRSLGVAFGASLARSEVESILQGDGSSSEMLGLYFAHEDQHVDHRSIQDHVGSQTSSDLLYKGALKGTSRTIYSGNVIIRQGAHRCDAYQTNRNILLSETAKADSIPNLEILSNDPVRCGHAASIGPVDEQALFYLESRGIPAEEAERLIVTGFFQEVIDRVSVPEVTDRLERAIAVELEG